MWIDRRGRRVAQVAARLLAGTLLVGAVLACSPSTPTTAPSAPASAAPTLAATQVPTAPLTTPALETPADTPGAGAPACSPADLKASHGIVEGAAGSILTEVVIVSAATCSVDAFPALGLRDNAGTQLVGAPSAGPGLVDLVAGVAYTTQVRVANWCAPEPSFPVELVVVIGTDELAVTGGSFPEEGDLPPCNGEVGPVLEGTEWMPTP